MPDRVFAERRLAELYDVLEGDRADLDVYAALLDQLGTRRALVTANVAQVFLDDEGWLAALRAARARFETIDIRDAPDRPGLEFVFVARRSGESADAAPQVATVQSTRPRTEP